MVIQDFGKHGYITQNQQDMIVVFVEKGHQSDVVSYHHFVGSSGVKNDVYFSMYVWYLLLNGSWYDEHLKNKDIVLWSDHGPKHCKCSAFLLYLVWVTKVHKSRCGKALVANFSGPYHGPSLADTAHAHAVRASIPHTRETRDAMMDPRSLVSVIENIDKHHDYHIEKLYRSYPIATETMTGTTSYFCHVPQEDGTIHAWSTSFDRESKQPPDTVFTPRIPANFPYAFR